MLLAPVLATAALLNLPQFPLNIGQNPPPLAMLVMSKDHQLFKKAYIEYDNNAGDDKFDPTFSHTTNYYGYFDPFKCYTYSDTDRRFNPDGFVNNQTDKYCAEHYAEGNTLWSGNFLNWITMTRIDLIRKVLYGGFRSPVRNVSAVSVSDGDTSQITTLERAYLPWDSHAFAKR
jgi:type IV pilus assembly protein PilY1